MSICIAESGEGKDKPMKLAQKLITELGYGDRVYKKMASGAALMDALEESPSMNLIIDEMGNYLASVNGNRSNQFSKEIVGIITECYTSGSSSFTGKKLKDFHPEPILEPNISVIGSTTEGQLMNGLSSSDISDGSLARYFVVYGKNKMMPTRVSHDDSSIPKRLIHSIENLIKQCNSGVYLYSKSLNVSEEYLDEIFMFSTKTKYISNQLEGDKAMFCSMYNRVTVRAVEMAILIDQGKSITVLEWCWRACIKSVEVFALKYSHTASDNDNEKYIKIVQAKIKESGIDGISSKELLQKTRQVPSYVRKSCVTDMLDAGLIFSKKRKVEGSRQSSLLYFWRK
jgi:hypothetical protein